MVFYFWIRKQVRRFSKPIPIKVAERYDTTLSFVYVFCAWSALGIVLYRYVNRRSEMKAEEAFTIKNSAMFYGRTFRAPNMQVISVGTQGVIKEGVYEAENDVPPSPSHDDFYGEELLKSKSGDD